MENPHHGQSDISTPAQLQQAAGLFQQGRIDDALALALQAPDSAGRSRLLVSMFISRHQPSDLKRALKVINKWKKSAPRSPEPWGRQLEIHLFSRQLPQALQALRELQKRAPRHSITLYYQALLLQLSGRLEQAFRAYTESMQLQQQLNDSGRVPQGEKAARALAAIKIYETAIGGYPGSPEKNSLRVLDLPEERNLLETHLQGWEDTLRASGIPMAPAEAETLSSAWHNLGCALLPVGEAEACFQRALACDAEHRKAWQDTLFVLNYSSELSAKDIYLRHKESARQLKSRFPRLDLKFRNDPNPDRPLKIAYLSSDFRRHPVAHFILPVLQNHDAERVKVFLYYDHASEDDYTEHARQRVGEFRQVHTLTHRQLAGQIFEDGIDILVDLNGYTGFGRMPVLAMRPAPLQLTWMGYPNTTGLDTVDYRLVDEVTNPPATAQPLCSEKLLYLPGPFSVYDPLDDLPPVSPLPCLQSGTVTFGSFNNLAKVNDSLLVTWAEILRRVPGSRLELKDAALGLQTPRRKILDLFRQQGIDSHRVGFTGYINSRLEHLQCYNAIDISLDTFPYNGTTTTCESLIMGVPVVSRAGEDHRSRVGASLLHTLGLDDWVALGENETIEHAVRFAQDPAWLEQLRQTLRPRMQASPLMDANAFTRGLETALQGSWARWCDQAHDSGH